VSADKNTAQTVVVIGHGMVGHRFCERLLERDTERRFRIVVFGEEQRPAYDRVHLSEVFSGRSEADLELTTQQWYAERGAELLLGDAAVKIDPQTRSILSARGRMVQYDWLVLATGSAPFVPPVPGTDLAGVFVYRTLEDLAAIRAYADGVRSAAVIGGGLLGLEAAKACVDMKLDTHVVEFAPRLMPRQIDAPGGEVLRRAIEALGVHVHASAETRAIQGPGRVTGLQLRHGDVLPVDMVIISAGIRPRDELARDAKLRVGTRGGICVDGDLRTSDERIFAIGECALHDEMIYGLVAPGYEMADIVAGLLTGQTRRFSGADMSTKLKLLGVDVASFGDPFADEDREKRAESVRFVDAARGVYQKLVLTRDGTRLLGGVLIGNAERYAQLHRLYRSGDTAPERPHELLFGASSGAADAGAGFADDDLICSCNQVTKGTICAAIAEQELTSVSGVKACTKAGAGCGGCLPFVKTILETELAQAGREVDRNVCEHFPFTRQELFQIVKVGRYESFEALLAAKGQGSGCEVCRPVVASILASTWNDFILKHASIQDTNDRFLANIQRGGTYSVVPRCPGGEITAEKLIVLGEVAKKYDLYCKITGGQRIDLFGARVNQLPDIWEELVEAGFESGHAYGKALRTVKSCVGSSWCRYGVQDSTGFAIRVEERYRGMRSPHKLKSAVSGCIRECAEAQNKDFGIIATEKGWNLYVCGNGGSSPRHGDLLAADIDSETVIRYLDRYLMYYIQTANPLERTARWLERLDGGIAYLRAVVVDDMLGIAEQLEKDMASLVGSYACEWAEVVRNPTKRAYFRHFANSDDANPEESWITERGQKRPADWPTTPEPAEPLAAPELGWVKVAEVGDFPRDCGVTVKVGGMQIAVFNFTSRGEWYATQAVCPHKRDAVLGRGMLGDHCGVPKVACPMHKKTFSLQTGEGLSDPSFRIAAFPVEIRDGSVYVLITPAARDRAAAQASGSCSAHAEETGGTASEASA
jgi:NAD(P)H-dependent nitrite reductase large subunit/NAD(P)H-dependent nitrite reductase small subunit